MQNLNNLHIDNLLPEKAGGKEKNRQKNILHTHTIWRMMRRYTDRQIEKESIDMIIAYLEKQIEFIVKQSELFLEFNGATNQRIGKNCVHSIINNKSEFFQNNLIPDSKIEVA
jgi:hypothetical protein